MTTTIVAQYFPATIQLPGEPRPRRRVFVLLASGGDRDGLHVFEKPGDIPAVHLPVDWARTTVRTPREARNGADIYLVDGTVVTLTTGQGCRCGALGRFAGPTWASTVTVRA